MVFQGRGFGVVLWCTLGYVLAMRSAFGELFCSSFSASAMPFIHATTLSSAPYSGFAMLTSLCILRSPQIQPRHR